MANPTGTETPPQKKTAKLSLEIICPECGEMIECVDLAAGKTAEREVRCEEWCNDNEPFVVPAVWVKA